MRAEKEWRFAFLFNELIKLIIIFNFATFNVKINKACD